MLKDGLRAAICIAPVLLAAIGCSSNRQLTHKDHSASPHDHQIAVAQSYERKGEFDKARQVYDQILIKDPKSVEAKRRLDALVMAERRLHAVSELSQRGPNGVAQNDSKSYGQYSGVKKPEESAKPIDDTADAVTAIAQKTKKPAAVQTANLDRAVPKGTPKSNELIAQDDEFELPVQAANPQTEVAVNEIDPAFQSTEVEEFEAPISRRNDVELIESIVNGGEEQPVIASGSPSTSPVPPAPATEVAKVDVDQRKQVLDYLDSTEPTVRQIRASTSDLREATDSPLFGEFNQKLVDMARKNPEKTVPLMMRVLADTNAETAHRARAAYLLGKLGSKSREALPVMHLVLEDGYDKFLRIDVATAILEISPNDRKCVSAIVSCLHDKDSQVQWWAALCLRKCAGVSTTYAIPDLVAALRTSDVKLQRMVILTLAAYGPAAADAVPEIESAIADADDETRSIAEASLASITK